MAIVMVSLAKGVAEVGVMLAKRQGRREGMELGCGRNVFYSSVESTDTAKGLYCYVLGSINTCLWIRHKYHEC